MIFSAYAVIVVHNHPSGDPSPSQSDHSLTRRLREAVAAALCEQVEAASGLERLAMDLTAVHPSHSLADDE